MKTSILIIISQVGDDAKHGIDMALAASAFDVQLSIIFEKESKLLLKNTTQLSDLQKKISSWPWYDIHSVYVEQPWPEKQPMLIPCVLMTSQEINTLIKQHDLILRY